MKKKISMYVKNEFSLEDAFEIFLQYKNAMNTADATIRFYNQSFDYFTNFFGRDKMTNEVNGQSIIDYILYLRRQNPNISNISINTYLRGIRAILYFFMEKGYLEQFKIQLIKAEKK